MMKKMNNYQKIAMGFLIVGISAVVIYIFLNFSTFGTGGSGSDDSSFPFIIFFPAWVAIFIPIIVRQRQEEKMKREELEEKYEES